MTVRRVERASPRMVRVTFAGPELEGLTVEDPAASVRLLLPSPGAHELVVPSWNGNEFLLPDGRRPAIRTFTPRRVDPDAPAFLLAGDETAIPAISQLLEALPASTPVQVHVEVAHPDARMALPRHPSAAVEWYDLPSGAPAGDALAMAVAGADLVPGARVWVAGEAATMQRIRRHLFDDRALSRSQATVRGYWKHGRAGGTDDDA